MGIVRNSLLFHARDDQDTFIPDIASFPKPNARFLPRLVSESEMARISKAAGQLPPVDGNPITNDAIGVHLSLLLSSITHAV